MFDAAIEVLRDGGSMCRKECSAAIRVLEAAGKLSMDKTIDRLKAGMIPLALIDLLAALPDKGAK